MVLYIVGFLLVAASGISALTTLRHAMAQENGDVFREAISAQMTAEAHFQHSRFSYFFVVSTWLVIPAIVLLSLAQSLSTVRRKKLVVVATIGGSAAIILLVLYSSFLGYLFPRDPLLEDFSQLPATILRFIGIHALFVPAVSFLMMCITFWIHPRIAQTCQKSRMNEA